MGSGPKTPSDVVDGRDRGINQHEAFNSSPLAPMEALSVDNIPIGTNWQYEPKWDGFRCIMFRSGQVEIQSKAGKSLSRYFPELESAARALVPKAFVLDGEIAIRMATAFPLMRCFSGFIQPLPASSDSPEKYPPW
jgi:ATP-dependent DNA ligase